MKRSPRSDDACRSTTSYSPAGISSAKPAPDSALPRWPVCWERSDCAEADTGNPRGLPGLPHFPPKAKRVIYLFQSGGPSQMDLFDYKPRLKDMARTELPDSIRMGQRLTGMTSTQTSFPVAPSLFQVSSSTGSRAPGSANCCRTSPRCRTTSASSSPCTPRPSITIRR